MTSRPEITVFTYQEDDWWYCQSLNPDYLSEGHSEEDAKTQYKRGMELTLQERVNRDLSGDINTLPACSLQDSSLPERYHGVWTYKLITGLVWYDEDARAWVAGSGDPLLVTQQLTREYALAAYKSAYRMAVKYAGSEEKAFHKHPDFKPLGDSRDVSLWFWIP